MPNIYNDQGYPVDAFNLPVPQALTVQSITLTDQNDDGLIDTNDLVNGQVITAVYAGDTITVNGVQITGATIYFAGGGRMFTPTDGTILTNGTATASTWVPNSTNINVNSLTPICFARGTRIRAEHGDIPVEELAVGDLIVTADGGLKPILWIGCKTSFGNRAFAPVLIKAGALDNTRDLLVSQQHRMVLRGATAMALFGEAEVLAAAKHLTNGDTIKIVPQAEIEYFHILLDGHHIVYAEGTASESFHPGAQALEGDLDLREELFSLFPELADVTGRGPWALSRLALKSHEARVLAATLALGQ